ncbi:MAG: hypothetical protein HYS53_02780 [Candidatus Aenigmarchaeota archaeon]|nr:hypothetical protein [Candidatus Aenigmarchaeota archaeon]
MASESAILKAGVLLVTLTVLLLFVLVSGPRGVLEAFSTLSITTGLFILLALFGFLSAGAERPGAAIAVASVLIVGGFLASSTSGFTSVATFLLVFSAILVFVYGLAGNNKPDSHILVLTVAAAIIIFLGGGALPTGMSLTATGLMLLITMFGVMVFAFSKFSEESGWMFFLLAAVAVLGGFIFVLSGFLPTFIFAVLALFAYAAARMFPDSTSGHGVISWIGTASAILAVFFLASVQGLFPGLLRGTALFIMAAGLIVIAFFLRISEREIPGITGSGLLLGTILTLAGLYLVLF